MKKKHGNLVASKTTPPKSDLVGVPVMAAAKQKGGGFKKGGKVGGLLSHAADAYAAEEKRETKGRKDGGYAGGGRSHGRMDRPHKAEGGEVAHKAGGGAVGMRGRSPFSSASGSEPAKVDKCGGY